MGKIAVCILFLVAPLVAQRFVTSAPPAAATGPVFEASSWSRFSQLSTRKSLTISLSLSVSLIAAVPSEVGSDFRRVKGYDRYLRSRPA
jgi:hypothetical protein